MKKVIDFQDIVNDCLNNLNKYVVQCVIHVEVILLSIATGFPSVYDATSKED